MHEPFEIIFYRKNSGQTPVEEFLLHTDIKIRAKILREISLLKQNGYLLGAPHSKHLQNGIFELRIKQGSNIICILYFFFSGRKIVLTNAYYKKTQKTPARIIAQAMEYRKDYLNNCQGGFDHV